jgi:hypothetical protein
MLFIASSRESCGWSRNSISREEWGHEYGFFEVPDLALVQSPGILCRFIFLSGDMHLVSI